MKKSQIPCRLRYLKYIVLFMLIYPTMTMAAQRQVSVKGQSITVKQAIELIQKNSSYTFFYNAADLKNTIRRNIDCQGSIEEVLKNVFEGSGVTYLIKGNEIILKAGEPQSVQQQKAAQVTGVVIDEKTEEPIIGATIKLLGTKTGVITDLDGKFVILASPKDEIQVSFVGYVTKNMKVGNRKVISISLSEDALQLDEVVVTAFGTGQRKESVVGSIQTMRPADLKVPSANLSTSFAGRMAGVVAYQRSGLPGQNGADFYIRGISTISGITSPLIILDGVEVSSSDLNALDSEIIEGFSILKDATATAMYGTRGANGVMIVTTKSGQNLEKPIIGFRVEANMTSPTKTPKFVSGDRYMDLYNEAITNQGTGDVLFSNEQILGTRNGLNPYVFPNVNWYDEIFNDMAFNQKANFNIRGGTKKITYFMNLTVNHETGMLRNRSKDYYSYSNNINLMKYAFQNNIDFHMTKTSTISLHLNAQLEDMTSPAINPDSTDPSAQMGSIYGSIMNSNPVDFPVFFPNTGEKWVKWGAFAGGNDQGATNPLAEATKGYSDSFSSTVIANLDFDQKLDFITEGLRFKTMFSFKNWSKTTTNRTQGVNRYSIESFSVNDLGEYEYVVKPLGTPTKPVLSTSRMVSGDRRMYFQAYVDYNRSFGDHYVSGMALLNMDDYSLNAGAGLINSLPKRKVGYAFRASYDYAHRYMIEFNAGYNGSENFAPGKRFGFFPSIALGWNVSEEKFWEPISPVISRLKFRGSYGLVGNDQIGSERFIYMADVLLQGNDDSPSFTTGHGNNKLELKGPIYNRYQNNDITWEVGHKLNIGTDIQFFNALNLSVDVFEEVRSDIFQQKMSVPNYLGAAKTKIFGNLAKVKNWGLDLSADYGKQISRNFSMQFKGTFTFARNKVLEYDQAPGVRPANSMVGHPVNTIYGFVSDGLYIDQADIDRNPTSMLGNIAIAPGDIKYVDQPDKDGKYDGKITDDDKVAMGYPTIPEIVYGFGPSMTYKKWDFSFFFQGIAHTSIMMGGFHPFGAGYNRNVLQFVAEDRWSPTNQDRNANYPRLTKYENNNNNKPSDFWLRSGAFLKLKNVEFGYSFKGARIYVSGVNLLTFAPFKLWDPEMGGGAGLNYPTQRTFNIGFQMSFR